jgi:group I intron endonuclease
MPYKRIIGVYKISSKTFPNLFYIGSSLNILTRWKDHRHWLRLFGHDNPLLQQHFNKYGEGDLFFEIIEDFVFMSRDDLYDVEQKYLDSMNPPLNLSKDAKFGGRGHRIPQWLKDKMIAANTGRKDSPETTKRRSESHMGLPGPNKGKKMSPETCRKNRDAHRGLVPWNRGLTKETNDKIRIVGEQNAQRRSGMKCILIDGRKKYVKNENFDNNSL